MKILIVEKEAVIALDLWQFLSENLPQTVLVEHTVLSKIETLQINTYDCLIISSNKPQLISRILSTYKGVVIWLTTEKTTIIGNKLYVFKKPLSDENYQNILKIIQGIQQENPPT